VDEKFENVRRNIATKSMLNFIDKTFGQLPFGIAQPRFLPVLKAMSPAVAEFFECREALRKAAAAYAEDPSEDNLALSRRLLRRRPRPPRNSAPAASCRCNLSLRGV
jgi:hypothetical protein